MNIIDTFDGYDLYIHKPSVFNLFGSYYPEKKKLRTVIRFMLALKSGYTVYYLTKQGETVAYCIVQNGKSKRFPFADEKDILVGPIFVVEKYRGHGLASLLLDKILKRLEFKMAYSYIKKTNAASIKTFRNSRFTEASKGCISKFLRTVYFVNDDHTHVIMKLEG